MEIILIIGNGFDIGLGLKTLYTQFYKNYLQKESKSEIVNKMKRSIGKFTDGNHQGEEIINWGDAELAFGKFSKECSTPSEYRECYDDLEDNLVEYLKLQEKEFDINKVNIKKFVDFINIIKQELTIDEKQEVYINTINLNYTSTFYRIITEKKEEIKKHNEKNIFKDYIQLHSVLGKEPVFGVGNENQIINKELREKLPKGFLMQLIKASQDDMTKRRNYQKLNGLFKKSILYI